MRRLLLVGCVLVLGGCPKDKGAAPADQDVLAQVKSNFAEREKKLAAYELAGTVTQPAPAAEDGGVAQPAVAKFEVAYRAPNRMKGTVTVGAESHTYLFDGDRLAQVDPAKKQVIEYELKGSREETAVVLTEIFGSLIPEGFRAPVLDLGSATAKRTSHARAPEAVELDSTTRDESGQTIRVTYLFRWPAMDLLEKRLTAPGGTMTLKVLDEQCDATRKLCVPKKLEQTFDGEEGALTELSRIDLGTAQPVEAFTVRVPEGFATVKQPLGTAQ